MQNDSLVREFEEFQRTLTVREPPAAHKKSEDTVNPSSGWRGSAVYESATGHEERYLAQRGNRSFSTAAYPSVEKLSEGETIFLNETDTAKWKKVPGIGSAYASRIVKYRNLLGGFIRVDQLREVYGIDQEFFSRIAPYIESDGNFNKISINYMEFNELLHHPYLNYKQVQAIVSLRRKKGDIISIRELSILDEFTPEDILRLEPYLEF